MAKSAQPRYLDGKAVRRARLNAGLDQAQLGEKCDVTQSTVSGWESGYRGCRAGTLHKLAIALGVKPSDLMQEDPETDGEAA